MLVCKIGQGKKADFVMNSTRPGRQRTPISQNCATLYEWTLTQTIRSAVFYEQLIHYIMRLQLRKL